MFKLFYLLLAISLVAGIQAGRQAGRPGRQPGQQFQARTYKLCTIDQTSYNKCLHLVHVAQNSSIDLPLECVQKENQAACVRSVRTRATDLLVLTGHDYQEARLAGLYPVVFERDSNESLYIAVAPRNISLVEVANAPIEVDQNNHRAFHAAAYFNLRRGHDICLYMRSVQDSPSIRIVDSADYVPSDDEILLCPDGSLGVASDYQRCNFEADLQRAIFIPRRSSRRAVYEIQRILSTVLRRFGSEAERDDSLNDNNFNFFTTFEGIDDVIFKNNAVAFDYYPTFLNGFSEAVFNLLHCNTEDHHHDPSQLE